MNEAVAAFRGDYHDAFTVFLDGGGEAGLWAAYELGRTAMLEKLSMLDLAWVHHDVLFGMLGDDPDPRWVTEAAAAGSTFFVEVLATYEMVQRGVAEAHQTARLQRQHAERLRRLAEASVVISAPGTLEDIARRITEQAVRVMGAAAGTIIVESARDVAVEHSHPPQRDHGDVTSLEAPLVRRNGRQLGRLSIGLDHGLSFTGDDEAILTQLARMAGVALENAELYERERLVAETLQRRLLPDALPQFSGVTMARRYLPGWRDADIGGDWYDAIVLSEHHLALVVGDVMGKGIRAAAGMGQLRIALRAYAVEGHPPAVVISRLDQVFEELEEDLATVVYLVYDPADATLRYANAGHPPPLLITPGGSAQTLSDALSPPLGCLLGHEPSEGLVHAVPGSTLVVYTDGLIERRRSDIDHQIDRLVEVAVGRYRSDLDSFCEDLLTGLDARNRGDDVALLVARLGSPDGE